MISDTASRTYRGFTEPRFEDDDISNAMLRNWRQGVDTVLDHRAKPDDTTIYAHRSCETCRAIRRDWHTTDRWIQNSYWRPIADSVPFDVLLDMNLAELHALHHQGNRPYTDAIIFAGIRVLTHYYTSQDTVLRAEMNQQLSEQAGQQWQELKAVKATADEKVRADYEHDLREARTRIANVEALVTLAFRAKHKTMRYDEVRAAIEWRTGEEIPQATVDNQREIRELQGRSPR